MSPPTQPLQHYDEFKAALKESLASRGVLNKLQASIRQGKMLNKEMLGHTREKRMDNEWCIVQTPYSAPPIFSTSHFPYYSKEIFAVLDEDDPATAAETRAGAGGEGSGSSFNGNLLINELIRDYLKFNGLRHSLAVFMAGKFRVR